MATAAALGVAGMRGENSQARALPAMYKDGYTAKATAVPVVKGAVRIASAVSVTSGKGSLTVVSKTIRPIGTHRDQNQTNRQSISGRSSPLSANAGDRNSTPRLPASYVAAQARGTIRDQGRIDAMAQGPVRNPRHSLTANFKLVVFKQRLAEMERAEAKTPERAESQKSRPSLRSQNSFDSSMTGTVYGSDTSSIRAAARDAGSLQRVPSSTTTYTPSMDDTKKGFFSKSYARLKEGIKSAAAFVGQPSDKANTQNQFDPVAAKSKRAGVTPAGFEKMFAEANSAATAKKVQQTRMVTPAKDGRSLEQARGLDPRPSAGLVR